MSVEITDAETFTREQMLAEVDRRVERALFARNALAPAPVVPEDVAVLRMVMVLHEIRDYAHGYVDHSVRSKINSVLDAGPAPAPAVPEDVAGLVARTQKLRAERPLLDIDIDDLLREHLGMIAELVADSARLSTRLAQVEKERDEASALAEQLNSGAELQLVMRMHNETIARAEAAEAERDRLREALLWYASPDAWTVEQVEGVNGDYGKRARTALAEGGKTDG